jgi:flagellar biosynthesis protein FlhG
MSQELTFSLALPPLATRPRTIAFTSGKGGVGKSNLVLNTALLLARRGRRVAVLDGDLGLASINVLLGQSPRYDLRHVLAGSKRLSEVLLTGPHGLRVIPAGSGVVELANLGETEREALLAELGEIEATVDFLLIDTGAGITDTVLDLITASDEAIVVTRPEPTALADAYAVMKVVLQLQPAYPFHLLVNMVRDQDQARQVFGALSQILERFLGYRPGYAGHVVTDRQVGQGVVQQVPVAVLAPASPAVRCLDRLVDAIVGEPSGAARAPGTFWQRVAGLARVRR